VTGHLGDKKLGWIGTGRMGYALVSKLLDAGCDVAVYNRTRAKAEPLVELGATIVDSPAELADRDVVFTIVAGSADLWEVVAGDDGVLSREDAAPSIIVDITTVSAEVSAQIDEKARERGVAFIAAPVSGNPKVVAADRLTFVVSGPEESAREISPYLELMGCGFTYVGEGDRARLAKICHNLMLGIVAQTLAEITVLAEKGGISRAAFLEFLNRSVMGSTFTRYKAPAYVNLDYSVTFTPTLLLKDFDLGLAAGKEHGVPMPVAAAARQVVQALIGNGHAEVDFAALIELEASGSGLQLQPEGIDVPDGLEEAVA
jgi:3-hydroxyisobutyrate dehydrogenase